MSTVIFIDNGAERQWVSSPTNRLTYNPNRAAVVEDEYIDGLVSHWRRQSIGKVGTMPYREYNKNLSKFHNDWVRGGRKSSARADRIARVLTLRFAKAIRAFKTWMGSTTCDICHKPIAGYLYDAVTESGWGSWGTMCKRCWQMEGAHLGEGMGQEFVETEPGKFELNRGGIGMGKRKNHLKPCKRR